jgi:hypothetical protein
MKKNKTPEWKRHKYKAAKKRYVLGEGIPFAPGGRFDQIEPKTGEFLLSFETIALCDKKLNKHGSMVKRVRMVWPDELIPWPHPVYRLVLERVK